MIALVILSHYLIDCLCRTECSLDLLALSLALTVSHTPTTPKLLEQQEMLF